MGGGGRSLSRRGLLGIFGRGLRDARDVVADEARVLGGSPSGATPPAYPTCERVLRPPGQIVGAMPDGLGSWLVDLFAHPLPVGGSVRVEGGGLVEPLVLVRVHETHYGACTSWCPYDGSDLLWAPEEDRLRCPSCGTRWRLDGVPTSGPTRIRIANFLVDAGPALARVRPS